MLFSVATKDIYALQWLHVMAQYCSLNYTEYQEMKDKIYSIVSSKKKFLYDRHFALLNFETGSNICKLASTSM